VWGAVVAKYRVDTPAVSSEEGVMTAGLETSVAVHRVEFAIKDLTSSKESGCSGSCFHRLLKVETAESVENE
jgi:hypothetical protein